MTVGYTRQSIDKYGDLLGVTRQREDIVALAAALEWSDVTEFYQDNDITANVDKKQPRPAFERLLHDIRSGTATHVLCYDQDRLVRDMRQLEDVVDAVEAGGAMLTSVNGDIDLLTDNGRMVARIKAAVARNEIEKMSRRIRRQRLQQAQNGSPLKGGRRTYGYTKDFVPVAAEAAVLVELFRRKAAGESTSSLVAWLNATKVPTSRGNVGKWEHGAVQVLIRRRTYVGDVLFKGQVVAQGSFTPIVDVGTFEAANAQMPSGLFRAQPGADPGLLTHLLTCGLCQGRMRRGQGATGAARLYQCRGRARGCGRCNIGAKAVDAAIVEAARLKVRQQGPADFANTASSWSSSQVSALEHEIEEAQRRHAQGRLARADWSVVVPYLRGRLAIERKTAQGVTAYAGSADELDGWDDWNLETRREWLSGSVRRVVVNAPQRKANGVRPGLERVTVHFKDGEIRTLSGARVSQAEVARLAGCSAHTVSRALRGHGGIAEATRERVLAAAQASGYVAVTYGVTDSSRAELGPDG